MAELGALDLQEEEPGLLARAMAFLRQNPGRMPTMEDRTPGIDRPAQRGVIDEVGTALMVPQSPLDFGMLALGGPLPKAAKLGAVALGAAMEPSEAEAGGAGKMAALLEKIRNSGYSAPWYHGSWRSDRLVEKGAIDPKRATSGPMPFFTDSPELGSGYAMGKKMDTSLPEGQSVGDYFTVSPKDLGIGGRSPITVERSWHFLPPEVKQDILSKMDRVGYANPDRASGPLMLHPREASIASPDHIKYIMNREERGNPLAALRNIWHDGGGLIGDEAKLMEIYRLAGYPYPISDKAAPWVEARGVLPAALRLSNPLLTENESLMQGKVLPFLENSLRHDRTRKPPYSDSDMWDKRHRFTPREWVAQAKEDYGKGDNSFVWTSIPDKVTDQIKRLGYDSIIDTGGKMGGQAHKVAIPFWPEQVRSIFAKFDPEKIDSKKLMAGVAGVSAGPSLFGSLGPEEY